MCQKVGKSRAFWDVPPCPLKKRIVIVFLRAVEACTTAPGRRRLYLFLADFTTKTGNLTGMSEAFRNRGKRTGMDAGCVDKTAHPGIRMKTPGRRNRTAYIRFTRSLHEQPSKASPKRHRPINRKWQDIHKVIHKWGNRWPQSILRGKRALQNGRKWRKTVGF